MQRVRKFIWQIIRTGAQAFQFTKSMSPCLTWVIVFFSVMTSVLTYAVSVTMSLIANDIQQVVKGTSSVQLTHLLWAFALITIITGVFNYLQRYFTCKYRNIINFSIRNRVHEKRYSLDAGMIKSERFETLVQRIEEAPNNWRVAVDMTNEQFEIIALLVSLIASAWIVSSYSIWIMLILLFLSVPQFVIDYSIGKKSWGFMGKRAARSKRRNTAASCLDDKTTLLEVQLFNAGPLLFDIIRYTFDELMEDILMIEKQRAKLSIAADLLFVTGLVYCMYNVAMAAKNGEILIGTMMLVMLSGFKGLQTNTRSLLKLIAQQYEQSRYFQDVMEFFDLQPLLATPTHPVKLAQKNLITIEFRNVWFKYDGQEEFAISNLNLVIRSGEKVGIYGENGSGKSTLLALLSRFYYPTRGDIYINGVNIKDVDPTEWSRSISVLLQSHGNYDFKVRESIGISDVTILPTDERIRAATQFANAHEVIDSLPSGYDAQLGQSQGGKDLSGGQYKRLAIARRMFTQRPVVLFDEPENKLDVNSKETLFTQLGELPDTTTAIYISHSLETLGLAERILVFEKGRLVEDGTSEELLADPDSRYRRAMVHAWDTMKERMETLQRVAPEVFA